MSVCLFVCQFVQIWSPNYWMDSIQIGHEPPHAWSLWVTSKYLLFWVDNPPPPDRGIILEKLKKKIQTFPIWPCTEGGILLRHLLSNLRSIQISNSNFFPIYFFLGVIWILFNGPSGARPVIGQRSSPHPAALVNHKSSVIDYSK